MRATVGHPATVSVATRPGEAPQPTRGRRLVVTVEAFQPSPSGPVVAVVTALCGANAVEVGRWGVFPDAPFSAIGTVKPLRFGLNLPDTVDCDGVDTVTISLMPSLGDGTGAILTVRRADFQ